MSVRATKLEALYQEQAECKDCSRLVQNRTQVVRGRGNPDARIVFVGEGPGEDEDREGVCFCGRAGSFLETEIFAELNLSDPEDDFYIINTVACRAAVMNVLRGKLENVQPSPDEIQSCRKWLHKIIRIIDPYCLVLSGSIACQAFGLRKAISSIQGRMVDVSVSGVGRNIKYCAMPIYHPAFLMRKRDVPQFKEVTISNLAQVVERSMSYMRIAQGLSPIPLHEEE